MSDAVELRRILKNWPYDPEHDARIARGADGRDVLQVRTPLGIEQHELDGRPDGARPHGAETALDYYVQRFQQARAAGQEKEFELNARQCTELFNEGTLFYFRYVRLFQLRDWTRTIRDTARNLRAFDFIHRHAARDQDRCFLEKWRPYILRVNASAAVMRELDAHAHAKALRIAHDAIAQLEALDALDDETFRFEQQRSLLALRELAAQVEKNRPVSELEQLEQQLRRAIERQDFERAAQLRDRIRALRQQPAA
jgi:hypothetical protein